MDFEKYTERARGFIQAAQNLALREGHQRFTPDHILKVLIDDEQGLASGLIKGAGGDARGVLAAVEGHLEEAAQGRRRRRRPALPGARDRPRLRDRQPACQKAGDSFVTAERLLQALAIERPTRPAR